MYALIIITHWYYCEKSNVRIQLCNTLKTAQSYAAIHTDKLPEIVKIHNNKTTWQYPPTTNGSETFEMYITNDIKKPCDSEVQLTMFDKEEW